MKTFSSATHAFEAIGSNPIFLRIPPLPLQDHWFFFSFLVLQDLYLQKHMFNHSLLQEVSIKVEKDKTNDKDERSDFWLAK